MRSTQDLDRGDWTLVVQGGMFQGVTHHGDRPTARRIAEWLITLPQVESVAVVSRDHYERARASFAEAA